MSFAFLPELPLMLMAQKWQWVKMPAPSPRARRPHNCTQSLSSPPGHVLTVKKENPVSRKNVFDEAVTVTALKLDLL